LEIASSTPSGATLTLTDDAPVQDEANPNRFRYFFTGTFQEGALDLTFVDGGVVFVNDTDDQFALLSERTVVVQKDSSNDLYIDVRFGGVAGSIATPTHSALPFTIRGPPGSTPS